jgi:hypothetical protein
MRSRPNPIVATGKLGPALEDAKKIDGFPTRSAVMPKDFNAAFSSTTSNVLTPELGLTIESQDTVLKEGEQALKNESSDRSNLTCINWPLGKDPEAIPTLTVFKNNFTFKGKIVGKPERDWIDLVFLLCVLIHNFCWNNDLALGSRYWTTKRSTSAQ